MAIFNIRKKTGRRYRDDGLSYYKRCAKCGRKLLGGFERRWCTSCWHSMKG